MAAVTMCSDFGAQENKVCAIAIVDQSIATEDQIHQRQETDIETTIPFTMWTGSHNHHPIKITTPASLRFPSWYHSHPPSS